ncbi:MAG: adenylate/guanylate cyclase domain-containing protein [Spirochaetota bacterium]
MATTRLEAIMFTDIADYARLMDEDEDRTIELLKVHNQIVLPVIEADSGQVVNSIADGLLVVFPSARAAVSCAVTIHERIAAHNDAAPEDERFKLRIGVHIGEVRHDGDRVFGTGVNIAARVQPFALPGGICVTEDVVRQIERRIPQRITGIGNQQLKSIARGYELYRVETGHEDEIPRQDEQGFAGDTPTGPPAPAAAKPAGELDEVKEKILTQIARWSERSRARDPESKEARTESKVYRVVETIMDKALQKWESMPEEKRSDIVHKINVEIEKSDDKNEEKDSETPGSIAGSIVWGSFASAAAAYWYVQVPGAWPIILGILVGVLPLMSGITNLIKRTISRPRAIPQATGSIEREVLAAAGELGGRVTVVQVAARTGHGLDEVQAALDSMSSKGYVSVEVLESGVVRYDFPSLLAENTDSEPIG